MSYINEDIIASPRMGFILLAMTGALLLSAGVMSVEKMEVKMTLADLLAKKCAAEEAVSRVIEQFTDDTGIVVESAAVKNDEDWSGRESLYSTRFILHL